MPPQACPCALASQDAASLRGSRVRTRRSPDGQDRRAAVSQFPGGTAQWESAACNSSGLGKAYLVEEVVEELDADEHCRRVSQLVGYGIEEDFWTEDVVLRAGLAPLGLECRKTQFENAQPVRAKNSMAS